MNIVANNLRKAKEVISQPEKWTKGFYSRDALGNKLPHGSGEAVCFCAIGAIEVATGDMWGNGSNHLEVGMLGRAIWKITGEHAGCVPSYNDAQERTHSEILKLFDVAIELAEKGGV